VVVHYSVSLREKLLTSLCVQLVQEFVLGSFDEEATAALHQESPNVSLQKDPRSQSAAQRYHAHVYTNGTICDLTDQRRETEVRFVCSETGRALINSIKEAPTCKYTVVFHAPMLCKHPYAPHVFPDT
jgi:protein OS-9